MRKLIFIGALPLLAGCLTAVEPDINHWAIEYDGVSGSRAVKTDAAYGVVRMAQVVVRSPYDGLSMVVLRKDGTIAMDTYNEYASEPSAMMRGVAFDAFIGSGKFKSVIGGSSSASEDVSAEITVTRFCLDCRQQESRKAVVELQVRLVKAREIVKVVNGAATAEIVCGDFGKAFSKAITQAFDGALRAL